MPEKVFRFAVHADGVAEWTFDAPEKSVNVLTSRAMEEFEAILENLERDRHVKGLLFRSAKDSFVAGADVREIAAIVNPKEAEEKAARGQRLLDRLARLAFPSVAAVRGACLGGGTELALACRYRVLSDSPATRMGLPEILLGIVPGFGGTQRLPRVVGIPAALDMILTGKQLAARQALKLGLADAVFPDAIFEEESMRFLREDVLRRRRPPRTLPLGRRVWVEGNPAARAAIRFTAKRHAMKKTRGHYPAAPVAVEMTTRAHGWSMARGLQEEARAVGPLIASSVSKNLIRLFFLQEEARKLRVGSVEPPRASFVGVVGAGVMGGGIAQLAASRGLDVRLKDVREEAITLALRTARDLFDSLTAKRRLLRHEAERAMGRIMPTLRYEGFERADAVLEAVVERMEVKKQVFSELEKYASKDCVFATNTSALSISEMARGLKRPERVVGLHFFNPVHKMPLVEIVRGEATSDEAVAAALALAQTLGKTPVVVKDSPGFLVNRLLTPYMMAAVQLVEEGVPMEAVERAALDFGMPMGPLALFDEVGIDVARHVGETLRAAFPERVASSPLLDSLYEKKQWGKKTGRGFYVHEGGKRRPHPDIVSLSRGKRVGDLMMRLFRPVVEEARLALKEGVVARAEDIDLAMVMGTGFAPFRGGPMRWAESAAI